MADDNQDNQDEYQFADLDVLGTEQDTAALPEDELIDEGNEGVASPPGRGRFDNLDPNVIKMIRNGVIAVGALIFVLFIYKFIASFFTKTTSTPSTKTVATQPIKQTPLPIQVATPSNNQAGSSTVTSLKTEQKRIEEELSAVRTELATVTQSANNVAAQMADVKQTMLVISERLEQQSQQMGRLQTVSRSKSTASRTPARRVTAAPRAVYAIQAVIPGRAWLMSDQGSSLTVSRGSSVPGYGTVRVINAKVGRVFTSSGRVIRFSQADT
jgi:intracellular multiplication protein IcmG